MSAAKAEPAGPGAEAPVCELRIPARAERLRLVRATVAAAAACCGCGEACAEALVTAVDEACQNVIRHAYPPGEAGDIVVRVTCDEARVVIRIVDFAPPIEDPERVRPRALADVRPGGLGTHFIRQSVDEAGFEPPPAGAGNVFRMVKWIER